MSASQTNTSEAVRKHKTQIVVLQIEAIFWAEFWEDATQVGEYRKKKELFSRILSDAERMPKSKLKSAVQISEKLQVD